MSSDFDDLEDRFQEAASDVIFKLLARVPENNIRPRLEPTARLAALLGEPQNSYRVIHLTGTNGKTSTARFIDQILRELGLRVGRLTSPHLVRLNERIVIDGDPVSNEVLVAIWNDIEPIVELVDEQLESEGEPKLTFFEVLTVLAFAVFADAPVDVVVLEVGMGGSWDATNIATADVAVFTPIGLDHTDRLGSTLAEIAQTKAGIIKNGSIVVTAAQQSEALAAIESVSSGVGERIFFAGRDFDVTKHENIDFAQRISIRTLVSDYQDLEIPVLGKHQSDNFVLAVAAVEAFLGGGQHRLVDDVVRASAAQISSPGRLQVLEKSPLVLLDAAHNPHGAKALAAALKDDFDAPYVVGVISVLQGKDADGFFAELSEHLVELVITRSGSDRAMSIEDLVEIASKYFEPDSIHVEPKPYEALAKAKQLLPDNGNRAVLVSGSITLIGDILQQVQLLEGQ